MENSILRAYACSYNHQ